MRPKNYTEDITKLINNLTRQITYSPTPEEDIEHLDESLVEGAKELLECSDLNIMAQSLGNNPYKKDNFQMAVSLNLKNELKNLNHNLKRFDKANKFSSRVMIALTIIMAILTAVLVSKGF